MKDMLKSKTVILFIVIMIGITFISSHQAKLEDSKVAESYLVYNLK